MIVVVCVFFACEAVLLKLFAGLEAYGLARRDCNLFACARVSAYAALSGLYDEDAEATQLYALAACERFFHRIEQGINGLLRLHLGHARALRNTIDNVEFNQGIRASVWVFSYLLCFNLIVIR